MTDDAPPRRNPLRDQITEAAAETGRTLRGLTVMATSRDPYRLDTDQRRAEAVWLRDRMTEYGLLAPGRTIHLRGLHYVLTSRQPVRPDGTPYRNTEAVWDWLRDGPAKAARWLGLVPFRAVVDERNEPPTLHLAPTPVDLAAAADPSDLPWPPLPSHPDDDPTGDGGWYWTPPDPNTLTRPEVTTAEDLRPTPTLTARPDPRPFRLALYGEKASLREHLTPLARRYAADLLITAGDVSDTLLYDLADAAADDPRPLLLLTYTDCDPRGWSMPVVMARKLAALADLFALDGRTLDFRVARVGLTPEQVRAHDLPVTPLSKPNARWTEATGVQQTEIDAVAALRPDLLTDWTRAVVADWTDDGLAGRWAQVRDGWLADAEAAVTDWLADPDTLDADTLDALAEAVTEAHTDAAALVVASAAAARVAAAEARAAWEAYARTRRDVAARLAVPDDVLPEVPEVPEADAEGDPLVSSSWPWLDQTDALIASRDYAGGLAE